MNTIERGFNFKTMHKKGQVGLNMIIQAILSLALAAIILVFGLIMVQSVTNTINTDHTNSTAYIAGNKTLAGLGKFGDYWDLIVLAIIITVIISLLLVVFSMRNVQ